MKYITTAIIALWLTSPIWGQTPALDTLITIDEILVSKPVNPTPNNKLAKTHLNQQHYKDLGQIFENVAGFNTIKRGNFAIEPIFRAHKYEQLNIQFNGATKVMNACPNRMDPITIHASPSEIKKIEVIKGPYSVRYGETFGGIVNLVTNTHKHYSKPYYKATLENGFESNGGSWFTRGDFTFTNKITDVNAYLSTNQYNNYKAGNQQTVLSSFRNYQYAIKTGFNIKTNQRLQINWRQNFAYDILHPGLPMDAKEDFSSVISADYKVNLKHEKVNNISVKFYSSWVNHLMTNEWRPNYKMVHALTDVNARTFGGKLETQLKPNAKTKLFVGINQHFLLRNGNRTREVFTNPCNGMQFEKPKQFIDNVWQGAYSNNLGVYAEVHNKTSEKFSFNSGLRITHIYAYANNLQSDFKTRYNNNISASNKVNVNWFFSSNFKLNPQLELLWSIGQGSRAPELIERYVNHFAIGNDAHEYVGNPNLKSENNYQTDFSVKLKNKRFKGNATVFYSYINNYISAVVDSSINRKYMPCRQPKFAKRFVNAKHVHQFGIEAQGSLNLTKHFALNSLLSYTWAQNASFNEPLAQVAPFSSRFGIQYKNNKVNTELSTRVVASQNRISSSFNETPTDKFFTLDYYINFKPIKQFEFKFSVDNILNKTYFEHLSRAYKNQSEPSPFYEPGRNFNISFVFNIDNHKKH